MNENQKNQAAKMPLQTTAARSSPTQERSRDTRQPHEAKYAVILMKGCSNKDPSRQARRAIVAGLFRVAWHEPCRRRVGSEETVLIWSDGSSVAAVPTRSVNEMCHQTSRTHRRSSLCGHHFAR